MTPYYSSPTTTLFVDDDRDFQLALSLSLPPDKGLYRFMHDPVEALECLRQTKINNISVVFMDYLMPTMTGLQVLEQAGYLCAEKILLTGTLDEKVLADALNRGLIDRHISKQDPDVIQKIIEALQTGTQNYFKRLADKSQG
ncbi:MAG: response regulator [Myxococcaceae bacterium]